ncbi:MAG: nitronate monooxygenase [Chloroflexi bacterium]|nr:nitronate monooxygenase [Chloroflexota bacterium]
MLRTKLTERLAIEHPIVLGGMGSGTSPALVAAVSAAGGLGILGATSLTPSAIAEQAAEIRSRTSRPFGLNLLLFRAEEERFAAMLAARPAVMSFAWSWPEQDLAAYFRRAHDAGATVMHMVSELPEAVRAVEAGADTIVAQGTEGGGHVGLMGTLPLVAMVARAVAPVPVLAAGGVADGRGLAASLALGAEGVLLGTRFLATNEAPIPTPFKNAIIASDGHDTLVTDVPDVAVGQIWPGAYVRVRRNRFVERWIGRGGELRKRRAEVAIELQRARQSEDVEESPLLFGQTAGLIDAIEPAGDLVRRIAAEAEAILRDRLPSLLA